MEPQPGQERVEQAAVEAPTSRTEEHIRSSRAARKNSVRTIKETVQRMERCRALMDLVWRLKSVVPAIC